MDNQLTAELKERYSIILRGVGLLEQAFTHSSYVSEHRYLKLSDNGRLEFLGDAALELIASQYLYLKFPELPEGKLMETYAAIVREDNLAKFVKECHFDNYILLSRGEEVSGGQTRTSLLCDLSEAFLGAFYLDQEAGAAKKFIEDVIFPKVDAGTFSRKMDHKAQLQKVLRRKGDASIGYRLIKKEGPTYDRTFFIEVCMSGEPIGLSQGRLKRLAEQDTVERALRSIPQQGWKG